MSYTNNEWTVVDPYNPVDESDPDAHYNFAARRVADPGAVAMMIEADETSGEGRSPWFWLRFPNGDLVLACFPQSDTYFSVEYDFARN